MILIDALYINDSGGKVLLDYLITELEATSKKIFYLLDQRIVGKVQNIKPENKVIFLKASLLERHRFYLKNRENFTSILCFGNLPPNIRTSARVYTYFHQLLYLNLPENMPFEKKMVYKIKTGIVYFFKKNTDYWLVQTSLVKSGLSPKYNINPSRILEIPFYPPFSTNVILPKIPNSYLYVSNAVPHKNHEQLIHAFSEFFKKYKKGTLTLTVSDHFPILVDLIKEKQKEGIPIINIGFVPRGDLQKLYANTEFLIFPSLTESFGLGLVEAIENGCKVIGADLPYTYAVCEPSLTFDPFDIGSIINALCVSLQPQKQSVSKVENSVHKLLMLLN